MPKKDMNQTVLIASAVIAIALVFNGFAQLKEKERNADLAYEIEKGIDAFIAKEEQRIEEERREASKPQVVEGDFADDDAVLGDPNAPVTMIEFSDYECPFCKRHFMQTFPKIKEKYIDTGKVKFIFRDFPLANHPRAQVASMASECVREQKGDKAFFAFHDLVFLNAPNSLNTDNLLAYAKEAGADEALVKTCLEENKFLAEVQKDLADGQLAGVQGTPGFLINDKLVAGAQPFSKFEEIIEAELAK